MMFLVLDSKSSRIWQFDQLEDAISKLGEVTTVSDPEWLIQSQLESLARYSIVVGNHWAEIFQRP
jgi:hypothetical protein